MRTPALIAVTAVLGVGVTATTVPALAATKTVKGTSKNTWSPKTLTVKKGDTVRFTWNRTGAPHNVRKTSGRGSLKGGSKISPKGSATCRAPAKGLPQLLPHITCCTTATICW